MEENCLAEEAYRLRRESRDFSLETRRLLRFTASIENVGDADFRPFIPKSSWEWHACHMHYHSMEVSDRASKVTTNQSNIRCRKMRSIANGNCFMSFLCLADISSQSPNTPLCFNVYVGTCWEFGKCQQIYWRSLSLSHNDDIVFIQPSA